MAIPSIPSQSGQGMRLWYRESLLFIRKISSKDHALTQLCQFNPRLRVASSGRLILIGIGTQFGTSALISQDAIRKLNGFELTTGYAPFNKLHSRDPNKWLTHELKLIIPLPRRDAYVRKWGKIKYLISSHSFIYPRHPDIHSRKTH